MIIAPLNQAEQEIQLAIILLFQQDEIFKM